MTGDAGYRTRSLPRPTGFVNRRSNTVRQLINRPLVRKLRVFAVDPGLTARFDTAVMNEMTLAIRWEPLAPGPVGEYFAVVDIDEKGKHVHDGVDLDDPALLAQCGLPPSDGNPFFRQQMAYAVGMRTVQNFERALGRVVLWQASKPPGKGKPVYRPRVRLHPHYLKEPNAYYHVEGGRLCFGYFYSGSDVPLPGTIVFTALSQDVIAHELVHAVLLGMGVSFGEENLDVLAFHEAFADLIPLFQHFWKSEVLAMQIAAIRGRLDERSALGAVALQFGEALGQPDGLRNALGKTVDGVWHERRPDPKAYAERTLPHDRGDILVAAVFHAFHKIFVARTADLRRIATRGSGILPDGAIHPDLVNRFTEEASKSARHVLNMCIRALDYMPPVDFTFGDYLRAIITADRDFCPIDALNYRVAFVEAFRGYGIVPPEVRTLSAGTFVWPRVARESEAVALTGFMTGLSRELRSWTLPRERERLWRLLEHWKSVLRADLKRNARTLKKQWGGLDFSRPFDIASFVPREYTDLSGALVSQWIVKIIQSEKGRKRRKAEVGLAPETEAATAEVASEEDKNRRNETTGVTLVIDSASGRILYRIAKPSRRQQAPAQDADAALRGGDMVAARPTVRRLRVFAFDPSLGVQLETAGINEITLEIPWERDRHGRDLVGPGPVGEYLEVIDRDPASACFYEPVDLNHPHLLAQDGLSPSESNPQFHQQMVYAVAMRTIHCFEQALGRRALWAPRAARSGTRRGRDHPDNYVQRLRIYPHALREANAYYSPGKVSVLLGYFPAPAVSETGKGTGVNVFTCLSHDIVAHEVTHALLDGMHRRFAEASNPDVLAFHEAFADIVALFQHFSLAGVLRHQIAQTRGDLASQNRLGELAQQFGQALGHRGALRSALGEIDETTGQWRPRVPDPMDYQRVLEPHDRGAILVAAVFDAFLTVYKARIADLLRIASRGTGVLPAGQLHPDLVNRLADEAASAAQDILTMCIRALDYCPPVDITFGDYLRAIVTADSEIDPIGGEERRIAMAEAFRRHGIVPEGVRTLSVDGLLWRPSSAAPDENETVLIDIVRQWTGQIDLWGIAHDRRELFTKARSQRAALHGYLSNKAARDGAPINGIDRKLPLEVHSIRPSLRSDWEGKPSFQWIVELTQRLGQYLEPAEAGAKRAKRGEPDYYVRGGCTLVIDATSGKIRYTIRKPLNKDRIDRQKRFILGQADQTLAATYFGGVANERNEPFAMLHRF